MDRLRRAMRRQQQSDVATAAVPHAVPAGKPFGPRKPSRRQAHPVITSARGSAAPRFRSRATRCCERCRHAPLRRGALRGQPTNSASEHHSGPSGANHQLDAVAELPRQAQPRSRSGGPRACRLPSGPTPCPATRCRSSGRQHRRELFVRDRRRSRSATAAWGRRSGRGPKVEIRPGSPGGGSLARRHVHGPCVTPRPDQLDGRHQRVQVVELVLSLRAPGPPARTCSRQPELEGASGRPIENATVVVMGVDKPRQHPGVVGAQFLLDARALPQRLVASSTPTMRSPTRAPHRPESGRPPRVPASTLPGARGSARAIDDCWGA